MSQKITISLFFGAVLSYFGGLLLFGFPITLALKPLPIFILLCAMSIAPIAAKKKKVLFGALLFSMLGDIVLTFSSLTALKVGIALFFVAHVFYILLFIQSWHFHRKGLFLYLLIFILVLNVLPLLMPHVGALWVPILFYVAIQNVMIFTALQVKREVKLIGTGAILFLFSDTVLAFNVFQYSSEYLHIVVMISYYAAQLLLTIGVLRAEDQSV